MATGRVRRERRPDTTELASTKVRVTVTPPGNDAETSETELSIHKFVTEPAYLRVAAGVTKSTGNYESLRVDVSVTYPCYREQITDELYERLSDMVASRLDYEIEQYLNPEDTE